MSDSNFEKLFEAAMNRYQRGGFLVGDRLEFVDGFKTKDEYKGVGDNVKDLINAMIDSGLNIRVTDIKNEVPSYYAANPTQSTGENLFLDIALDAGGGRYTHLCTIPSCLVKSINDGVNLPPIPDEWKRKNKVQIKPKEVDEDQEHITRKTDTGNAQLSNSELQTPTQNTKIPATPASPDPAVNAYMKALAK